MPIRGFRRSWAFRGATPFTPYSFVNHRQREAADRHPGTKVDMLYLEHDPERFLLHDVLTSQLPLPLHYLTSDTSRPLLRSTRSLAEVRIHHPSQSTAGPVRYAGRYVM